MVNAKPNYDTTRGDSRNKDRVSIISGGVNESIKSQFYQIKLFIYFLLKSLDITNFELSTEVKHAGKFDDILYYVPGQGRRLLQAKMRSTPFEIEQKTFFTEKGFTLKHFYSTFCDHIKPNFTNIKDLVLCTNNYLPSKDTDDIIELKGMTKQGEEFLMYLERVTDPDPIFGNQQRYRFAKDLNHHLKRTLNRSDPNVQNLQEFVEKFLLVVDVSIEKLDRELMTVLEVQFPGEKIDIVYNLLESLIRKWFEVAKIEKIYRISKYEEMARMIRNSLVILKNQGSIMSRYGDDINNPIFKQLDKDILDFLNKLQILEPVCWLQTKPGEVSYHTSNIYRHLRDNEAGSYLVLPPKNICSFEAGIQLFLNEVSIKTCVVELPNAEDFKRCDFSSLTENRKKILFVSDEPLPSIQQMVLNLEMDSIRLSDLEEDSLANILKRNVIFQKQIITFADLIDSSNQKLLEKIQLTDLESVDSIGESVTTVPDFDHKFYVSRKLVRMLYQQIFPENGIITAYELSETLQWTPSVEPPPKGVHREDSNDVFVITEEQLIQLEGFTNKLLILIDVAGMGKTSMLDRLAKKLKDISRSYWIVNVALNQHTDYFQKHTFRMEREILQFLFHVQKINNDFQKILFRELLRKGKVYVILDGMDEIAPTYNDTILDLIKVLISMSVRKVFVSTRPELRRILEHATGEIGFYFVPFREDDQKSLIDSYTQDFKDKEKLLEMVNQILGSIRSSFDHHEVDSIMGIPLIIKMIVEISKENVCHDRSTDIDNSVSNIYVLFRDFINKKIEILDEKNQLKTSLPFVGKLVVLSSRDLRILHQKLALKLLVDPYHLKKLKMGDIKISNEELDKIFNCGIVTGGPEKPAFSHKTFGEFSIFEYLFENIRQSKVQDFIAFRVFTDENFHIIRLFFNNRLREEVTLDERNALQKIVFKNCSKLSHDRNILFRTLSTSKDDLRIFEMYFKFLIYNESNLSKVASFLTVNNSILRVFYENHVDKFGLLEILLTRFGFSFIQKIFNIKFEISKGNFQNLLLISSKNRNSLKILDFLQENFSSNSKFVVEVLGFLETRFMQNFLFKVLENKSGFRDFLIIVRKVCEMLKILNERKFLENLFLQQNSYKFTLLHVMAKNGLSASDIIEFLEILEECLSTESLLNLFASQNQDGKLFWSLTKDDEIYFENYVEFHVRLFEYFDRVFNPNSEISTFENLLKLAALKFSRNSNPTANSIHFKNSTVFRLNLVEIRDGNLEFNNQVNCELFAKFLVILKSRDEFGVKFFLNVYENSQNSFKPFLNFCQTVFASHAQRQEEIMLGFGSLLLSKGSESQRYFQGSHMFWFKFLFDSICMASKTNEDQEVAEKILLANQSIFCNLDRSVNFLELLDIEKIFQKFGVEFVRKLLLLEISLRLEFKKILRLNIFHRFFKDPKIEGNSVRILRQLLNVFQDHPHYLEEVLVSRTPHQETFLHIASDCNYDSQIFLTLINDLREIEESSPDTVKKLLFSQNENGKTFLHILASKSNFPVVFQGILTFSTFDKFLMDFLLCQDHDQKIFLHDLDSRKLVEGFQILRNQLSEDQLKQLLTVLDKNSENFLFKFAFHQISHFEHFQNFLTEMKTCFGADLNFFRKLFCTKNKNNVNFLEKFGEIFRNFQQKHKSKVKFDENLIVNFLNEIFDGNFMS